RRTVRRNAGAARRLLPGRGQGSGRGAGDRCADSVRALGDDRGPAARGGRGANPYVKGSLRFAGGPHERRGRPARRLYNLINVRSLRSGTFAVRLKSDTTLGSG